MSLADIVAVMPPATWYELPGTKMSGVYAITDTMDPRYGVKGPKSVPEDWGGGAFDAGNNILLLHGGGHTSYGGNEVYAFSLGTLSWTVNIPSTYTETAGAYTTTDGSPTSAHTYDGLQCIPGTNFMFKAGGSNWISGNNTDPYAYLYDTVERTWARKAAQPMNILEPATAYDASRHCVWVLERNNMLRYNITADTWDTVEAGFPSQTGRAMAYDPVNDRLLLISGEVSLQVVYYDCATGGGLQTVTPTGDAFLTFRPGLVYDPIRAHFVVWTGSRSVSAIDPSTYVVTRINAVTGAAPDITGAADYHGTYGKWQYVPDHDVFIAYSLATGNVWLYKGGTAGSGPAPGWGDPKRATALTIPSATASGSLTGFPIVITRDNLPDEMCDPSSANAAQVNGGDVRVTADAAGTIRLPIDLRKFAHDSATGVGDAGVEFWTKLPTVSSTGTTFYIWHGSASTQVQPATNAAYGRDEVWSGLIGGWHVNSASTAVDITGGAADLSISGAATVTGPYADPAVNVDFNATCVSPSMTLNQDYTITFLVDRPGVLDSVKTAAAFFGVTGAAVLISSDSVSSLIFTVRDESNVGKVVASHVSFPSGAWTPYSVITPLGTGSQAVYADGSLAGSATTLRRSGDGAADLRGAATAIYWAEVFITRGLLSADWIATQHSNLSSPATFITAGTPTTPATVLEGVSATAAAGSLSVIGGALAALAGVGSSAAVGSITAAGGSTIALTGAQASTHAGSVAATGGASISLSGVQSASASGSMTATGGATVSVPSVSADGHAGAITISVAGGVSVTLSGVNATGSIGSLSVAGSSTVTLTGVTATGTTPGTIAINTADGVSVVLGGVDAAGQAGAISVIGGAIVSMSGAEAIGAVGTVMAVTNKAGYIVGTITITPALSGSVTIN